MLSGGCGRLIVNDLHPATQRIIARAGMTPRIRAALARRQRWQEQRAALWAGQTPAWLANSDDQQDTFDEDFVNYQQRQYEEIGQHE